MRNSIRTVFLSGLAVLSLCNVSALIRNVTRVLLPLDSSNNYVEGTTLRIHSPYYPCNVPNIQIFCNVTTVSEFDLNADLLVRMRGCLKFPQTTEPCQEELKVHEQTFCSQQDQMCSDDVPYEFIVRPSSNNILTFTYNKLYYKEGGKFIVQIDVLTYYWKKKVKLRISCDNQEGLDSGRCRRFTMPPSPTTTMIPRATTLEDIPDHTTDLMGDKTQNSTDNIILVRVLTGVLIAIILGGIIIILVLCRRLKRARSNTNRITMSKVPTTTTEEPLPFYSSVQASAETEAVHFLEQNSSRHSCKPTPLHPLPVYAVVNKENKRGDVCEKGTHVRVALDMTNDIVKVDNGEVLMCENTDLYDATSDQMTFATDPQCTEYRHKNEKDHQNISRKKARMDDGNGQVSEDDQLYSDTINYYENQNRDNKNRNVGTTAVYENI